MRSVVASYLRRIADWLDDPGPQLVAFGRLHDGPSLELDEPSSVTDVPQWETTAPITEDEEDDGGWWVYL